jgi:hypothetical protein
MTYQTQEKPRHSELDKKRWLVRYMLIAALSKNRDIYFKRGIDNGQTFEGVINLSTQGGASLDPDITISGNNIYVISEHTLGNNGPLTSSGCNRRI